MRFAKYHGTGNDFVLVEDLDDRGPVPPSLIAAICDRHRGVGADGLIRIVRGDEAGGDGAAFFMDYWNADGSVAQMCGNGIRCMGKYVFDRGLVSETEVDIATRAGRKRLALEVRDGVVHRATVDMGAPAFERKALPMTGDPADRFVDQPYEVAGRAFSATAVSMGNPHVVLFLPEGEPVDGIAVRDLGPVVERAAEFPEGTNVEFVRVVAPDHLEARVWERGSGETMACGTGACAVLAAAAATGRSEREADVDFPGGRLRIALTPDDRVTLTGPAAWVFDGELSEAFVRAALGSEGRG